MKRSHFGGMLFLTGSLGYLIFSLYLSQINIPITA